jgi:CheY-like chemotaxis protein
MPLVNILLLEDASGDVQLFKTFVQGENVRITVARNGAEALDRVFRRGRFKSTPVPNILVCDLNVPLLNGHEVVLAVKANSQTRRIPVVVWTSSDNPDDVDRAYEMGCCAYMVKTADIGELQAQLGAFCDFWLSRVRYPTYIVGSAGV